VGAIEGGAGIRTVGRSGGGGGGLCFDVQVVCWDLNRVRANVSTKDDRATIGQRNWRSRSTICIGTRVLKSFRLSP
jgi:hypothetical protein